MPLCVQGQWDQVLRRLPKRMPQQAADALHAELRGMQRAHATLSRLMQKLQDAHPPEATAASQAEPAPEACTQALTRSQCPAAAQNDVCDGSAAHGWGQVEAGQLQISQQNAEPSGSLQRHASPTAPGATLAGDNRATQDAAIRPCVALSQCLLKGWTCGPSQAQRQITGVASGFAAVATQSDVLKTPTRGRGRQAAVQSPPCIPDTPSDSEGFHANHGAGSCPSQATKQVCSVRRVAAACELSQARGCSVPVSIRYSDVQVVHMSIR